MRSSMKKISILMLVTAVIGLSVISGCAFAKADYDLSLATKMGPQSPEYKAFENFAAKVAEKTNGAVKISMFGSEVLGTDETVFKSMGMGAVDIVADSPVLGARTLIPKIDYITPPFVYTDFDHFQRFLKGDYMRLLFEELSIKAGIVVLNTEWTWRRGPFRVLLTKKPVESLADVQGLKLRFYPSELELAVWEAIGMNPTIIAWSETYLALQQGIVEAVTSPVTLIYDTKFVEVCPYITMTNEYPQTIAFYMNSKKFNSLPKDYQEKLVEACNEAGTEFTNQLDAIAEEIIEKSKADFGARFATPDMAPFREKAAAFYETLKTKNTMDEGFWEVMEAIEKAR